MASLIGWARNNLQRARRNLGHVADNVVPGNQSSWWQSPSGTRYQRPDPLPPPNIPRTNFRIGQQRVQAPLQNRPTAPYQRPGFVTNVIEPIAKAGPNIGVSVVDRFRGGHQELTPPKVLQPLLGTGKITSYQDRYKGLRGELGKNPNAAIRGTAPIIAAGAEGLNFAGDATAAKVLKATATVGAIKGGKELIKAAKPVVKPTAQAASKGIKYVDQQLAKDLPGAATQVTKPTPKPTVINTPKIKPPKAGASQTDYTDYLVKGHLGVDLSAPKNPNLLVKKNRQAQEWYKTKVDTLSDKVNTGLEAGLKSSNPVIRNLTSAPTHAFGRFGLKDTHRATLDQLSGQQENAGRVSRQLLIDTNDAINKTKKPEKTLDNLNRYFMDRDLLRRTGQKRVTYSQLSPEEKAIAKKWQDINKNVTNELNYNVGLIGKKTYEQGVKGKHTARIFNKQVRSKGSSGDIKGGQLIDTTIGKKRIDAKDLTDAQIAELEKNPIAAHAVRLELALRAKAADDALKVLDKDKLILKTAPNKNFIKLSGKKYGKYQGKYIYAPAKSEIDGHLAYKTESGDLVGKIIDKYQRTPLGATDRFFKATKTKLSPATTGGNDISNWLVFNSGAGVNSVSQAKNMHQSGYRLYKDAKGQFDPTLYQARKQGVAVGDTGKALSSDRRPDPLTVDTNSSGKNVVKKAGHLYGGIDQSAQLGIYERLIKEGVDPAVAARRVRGHTQNYSGVGSLIQNLADSPIVGKPFARFTPELLRIMKNNILYNPLGTTAKVGAAVAATNYLSKQSGETKAERQAREEAVGQTQLPFTSPINRALTGYNQPLSLNVAVPDKLKVRGKTVDLPGEGAAVNLARISGLNYPLEPNSNANLALVSQASPVSIPIRKDAQDRTKFNLPELVSSMTLRPVAEQIANRDFMNRTISDPENKVRIEGVGDKGKKYTGAPPTKDQINNRLKHLGAAYVPLFNEGNTLSSAKGGNKDYYGKDRTPTQAILRTIGIKVEKNDKGARQDRVASAQYFDGELAQINKFLRKNPNLANDYATLVSKTIDRSNNTRTNDTISPEFWKKLSSSDPALYGQFKTEAEYANKHKTNKSGMHQPIDPIYKLSSSDQIKQVLNLRSQFTADDKEQKAILRAKAPWFKQFEKDEQKYYKDNEKYWKNTEKYGGKNPPKDNPRVASYNTIPHAKPPANVQKYYDLRDKDPNAAKAYSKQQGKSLSAGFDEYKQAQLDEINKKRSIEGAPPIDKATFNNVSFGYQDDEKKIATQLYFKGKSSGGGKSSSGGRGRISGGSRRSSGGGGSRKGASPKFVLPKNKTIKTPKGIKVKKVSYTKGKTKKLSVKKMPKIG